MGACYKQICGICGATIKECPCTRAKKKIYKNKLCGKCNIGSKQLDIKKFDEPLKKKEYLIKIGDMLFYKVNEDEINEKFTTEFVMAGNWKRFKFIPDREGWISDNLDEFETKDSVQHEYIESHTWEYYNGNYNDAHYAVVKLKDYLDGAIGGQDGGLDSLLNGNGKIEN